MKLLERPGLVFLATIAISLSCVRAAEAATINVPADQPTLQQAISAASNGDTILVAPGTYHENINFLGKAITVASTGGPSVTTINGGGRESVVTFSSGEANSSVLEGFTITNGNASVYNLYTGGGIAILYASPTIRNNVVTNNAASNGGGIGLYVSPNAVIKNNLVTQNSGGGIYIQGGSVGQIIGNTISKNTSVSGGGISLFDAGAPTIENNLITGNSASQGGGIATVNQTQGAIVQNLIVANVTGEDGQGGGISLSVPNGSIGPTTVNNTIVTNQAVEGSGVYVGGFDTQTALYNNVIVGSAGQSAVYCDGTYGYTPTALYNNDAFSSSGTGFDGVCSAIAGTNGNISSDPLFLNATSDFRLQNGSPAAGTGNSSAPALPLSDFSGNPRLVNGKIDMGVYELQPATVNLAPATLTFAEQVVGSSSAAQPVTLSNTGNQILTLVMTVSANFTETDNCGNALAAGAGCTINVSFAPTTSGALTGALSITDNASDSPQTVSLSGTASTSPPDFSVAVASGGSSSATVPAGAAASYSLTVGPELGFNQTVSLACTGAPSLATCEASPSSVTLDGKNSQTVKITVTTTAPSSLLPLPRVRPISGGGRKLPVWPELLAILALVVWVWRAADGWTARLDGVKRSTDARVWPALRCAILFVVAAFAACGGGGGSNSPPHTGSPGTPAGTYTLKVTGTSGSLTHSVNLTLTVS
jgi:parallel beta-helix repeat protein